MGQLVLLQWRLKDTFIFCVNCCSERRDKLHCEQRSERVIELQHECVSSGLRWVLGELGILPCFIGYEVAHVLCDNRCYQRRPSLQRE